ncbi:uncharacterized protein LOC106674398 isoform X2 [Cimex lectularius]|uniref:Uncharacterized protein n=1 Tax=Cimex lectularius TaxID=79782 RepID=A0A8I6SUP7_CIMLE|nr:uncharacterized protein LOC106674398 isoform X2 [Cimex lectularius]
MNNLNGRYNNKLYPTSGNITSHLPFYDKHYRARVNKIPSKKSNQTDLNIYSKSFDESPLFLKASSKNKPSLNLKDNKFECCKITTETFGKRSDTDEKKQVKKQSQRYHSDKSDGHRNLDRMDDGNNINHYTEEQVYLQQIQGKLETTFSLLGNVQSGSYKFQNATLKVSKRKIDSSKFENHIQQSHKGDEERRQIIAQTKTNVSSKKECALNVTKPRSVANEKNSYLSAINILKKEEDQIKRDLLQQIDTCDVAFYSDSSILENSDSEERMSTLSIFCESTGTSEGGDLSSESLGTVQDNKRDESRTCAPSFHFNNSGVTTDFKEHDINQARTKTVLDADISLPPVSSFGEYTIKQEEKSYLYMKEVNYKHKCIHWLEMNEEHQENINRLHTSSAPIFQATNNDISDLANEKINKEKNSQYKDCNLNDDKPKVRVILKNHPSNLVYNIKIQATKPHKTTENSLCENVKMPVDPIGISNNEKLGKLTKEQCVSTNNSQTATNKILKLQCNTVVHVDIKGGRTRLLPKTAIRNMYKKYRNFKNLAEIQKKRVCIERSVAKVDDYSYSNRKCKCQQSNITLEQIIQTEQATIIIKEQQTQTEKTVLCSSERMVQTEHSVIAISIKQYTQTTQTDKITLFRSEQMIQTTVITKQQTTQTDEIAVINSEKMVQTAISSKQERTQTDKIALFASEHSVQTDQTVIFLKSEITQTDVIKPASLNEHATQTKSTVFNYKEKTIQTEPNSARINEKLIQTEHTLIIPNYSVSEKMIQTEKVAMRVCKRYVQTDRIIQSTCELSIQTDQTSMISKEQITQTEEVEICEIKELKQTEDNGNQNHVQAEESSITQCTQICPDDKFIFDLEEQIKIEIKNVDTNLTIPENLPTENKRADMKICQKDFATLSDENDDCDMTDCSFPLQRKTELSKIENWNTSVTQAEKHPYCHEEKEAKPNYTIQNVDNTDNAVPQETLSWCNVHEVVKEGKEVLQLQKLTEEQHNLQSHLVQIQSTHIPNTNQNPPIEYTIKNYTNAERSLNGNKPSELNSVHMYMSSMEDLLSLSENLETREENNIHPEFSSLMMNCTANTDEDLVVGCVPRNVTNSKEGTLLMANDPSLLNYFDTYGSTSEVLELEVEKTEEVNNIQCTFFSLIESMKKGPSQLAETEPEENALLYSCEPNIDQNLTSECVSLEWRLKANEPSQLNSILTNKGQTLAVTEEEKNTLQYNYIPSADHDPAIECVFKSDINTERNMNTSDSSDLNSSVTSISSMEDVQSLSDNLDTREAVNNIQTAFPSLIDSMDYVPNTNLDPSTDCITSNDINRETFPKAYDSSGLHSFNMNASTSQTLECKHSPQEDIEIAEEINNVKSAFSSRICSMEKGQAQDVVTEPEKYTLPSNYISSTNLDPTLETRQLSQSNLSHVTPLESLETKYSPSENLEKKEEANNVENAFLSWISSTNKGHTLFADTEEEQNNLLYNSTPYADQYPAIEDVINNATNGEKCLKSTEDLDLEIKEAVSNMHTAFSSLMDLMNCTANTDEDPVIECVPKNVTNNKEGTLLKANDPSLLKYFDTYGSTSEDLELEVEKTEEVNNIQCTFFSLIESMKKGPSQLAETEPEENALMYSCEPNIDEKSTSECVTKSYASVEQSLNANEPSPLISLLMNNSQTLAVTEEENRTSQFNHIPSADHDPARECVFKSDLNTERNMNTSDSSELNSSLTGLNSMEDLQSITDNLDTREAVNNIQTAFSSLIDSMGYVPSPDQDPVIECITSTDINKGTIVKANDPSLLKYFDTYGSTSEEDLDLEVEKTEEVSNIQCAFFSLIDSMKKGQAQPQPPNLKKCDDDIVLEQISEKDVPQFLKLADEGHNFQTNEMPIGKPDAEIKNRQNKYSRPCSVILGLKYKPLLPRQLRNRKRKREHVQKQEISVECLRLDSMSTPVSDIDRNNPEGNQSSEMKISNEKNCNDINSYSVPFLSIEESNKPDKLENCVMQSEHQVSDSYQESVTQENYTPKQTDIHGVAQDHIFQPTDEQNKTDNLDNSHNMHCDEPSIIQKDSAATLQNRTLTERNKCDGYGEAQVHTLQPMVDLNKTDNLDKSQMHSEEASIIQEDTAATQQNDTLTERNKCDEYVVTQQKSNDIQALTAMKDRRIKYYKPLKCRPASSNGTKQISNPEHLTTKYAVDCPKNLKEPLQHKRTRRSSSSLPPPEETKCNINVWDYSTRSPFKVTFNGDYSENLLDSEDTQDKKADNDWVRKFPKSEEYKCLEDTGDYVSPRNSTNESSDAESIFNIPSKRSASGTSSGTCMSKSSLDNKSGSPTKIVRNKLNANTVTTPPPHIDHRPRLKPLKCRSAPSNITRQNSNTEHLTTKSGLDSHKNGNAPVTKRNRKSSSSLPPHSEETSKINVWDYSMRSPFKVTFNGDYKDNLLNSEDTQDKKGDNDWVRKLPKSEEYKCLEDTGDYETPKNSTNESSDSSETSTAESSLDDGCDSRMKKATAQLMICDQNAMQVEKPQSRQNRVKRDNTHIKNGQKHKRDVPLSQNSNTEHLTTTTGLDCHKNVKGPLKKQTQKSSSSLQPSTEYSINVWDYFPKSPFKVTLSKSDTQDKKEDNDWVRKFPKSEEYKCLEDTGDYESPMTDTDEHSDTESSLLNIPRLHSASDSSESCTTESSSNHKSGSPTKSKGKLSDTSTTPLPASQTHVIQAWLDNGTNIKTKSRRKKKLVKQDESIKVSTDNESKTVDNMIIDEFISPDFDTKLIRVKPCRSDISENKHYDHSHIFTTHPLTNTSTNVSARIGYSSAKEAAQYVGDLCIEDVTSFEASGTTFVDLKRRPTHVEKREHNSFTQQDDGKQELTRGNGVSLSTFQNTVKVKTLSPLNNIGPNYYNKIQDKTVIMSRHVRRPISKQRNVESSVRKNVSVQNDAERNVETSKEN